jgi:dTDP-4-dehydrorhamnose reductase
MKLLVYGAKGWIGSQFLNFLAAQPNIDCNIITGEARIDDIEQLRNELAATQPSHVLSLVGRTSGPEFPTIDYLEQPGKLVENVRDNLYSPCVLAILAREYKYHFTYLGTGCIFNYDHSHNIQTGFTEKDLPNFTGSSYSTVKGFTDQLMHLLPVLNLRIRMPIISKPNPRNFITKIVGYAKICSIPNSMTVLSDFYPIWWDMISKNKTGTYNCTNPGTISHNEILTLYRDLVDTTFTWENFTIEEQDMILASKRSNNYLDTTKLQQEYPTIPEIQDSVRQVLQRYSKSN